LKKVALLVNPKQRLLELYESTLNRRIYSNDIEEEADLSVQSVYSQTLMEDMSHGETSKYSTIVQALIQMLNFNGASIIGLASSYFEPFAGSSSDRQDGYYTLVAMSSAIVCKCKEQGLSKIGLIAATNAAAAKEYLKSEIEKTGIEVIISPRIRDYVTPQEIRDELGGVHTYGESLQQALRDMTREHGLSAIVVENKRTVDFLQQLASTLPVISANTMHANCIADLLLHRRETEDFFASV
jgi:aspartate/glutamate racemase